MVANDPNSSPLAQETNQNLMKSSGQLLSTVNTFSANHFVRTCFEERFSGAVEVHRLLNTKDYATLLLKNYKYINDLLFNLNAPTMPNLNIAPLSARGGQNTDRLNESSLNRSGIRSILFIINQSLIFQKLLNKIHQLIKESHQLEMKDPILQEISI